MKLIKRYQDLKAGDYVLLENDTVPSNIYLGKVLLENDKIYLEFRKLFYDYELGTKIQKMLVTKNEIEHKEMRFYIYKLTDEDTKYKKILILGNLKNEQ